MSESRQNRRRWVVMRAGVMAWGLVFISAAIAGLMNPAAVGEAGPAAVHDPAPTARGAASTVGPVRPA